MNASLIVRAIAFRCLLRRFAVLLLLVCVACEMLPSADAMTVTCVQAGDFNTLQAALAAADHDNDDNLIKLQGGQYLLPSTLLLSYNAITENHSLTIEGGYGPTIGDDCGLPPTSPDARATVIDQGLWRLHMAPGAGSITLKSLTIEGAFSSDAAFSPVQISGYPDSTGDVDVENVRFLGNGSTGTSAIYLMAALGVTTVKNSLFVENVSFAASSAIRVISQKTGFACALVVNSTFTQNSSSLSTLDVTTTPVCSPIVANDIFWGNAIGADVTVSNLSDAYFLSDDLESPSEVNGAHLGDLYSTNPIFKSDLSLSDFSPLRDRGYSGGGMFTTGDFDVYGNPRVYHGDAADIGALELQDVIFADNFDIVDRAPIN